MTSLVTARGYEPEVPWQRKDVPETDLPPQEERQRQQYSVPLWKAHKLRLTRPVTVRVSRGEQLFLAENDHLRIYATGATPRAAVYAFIDELLELGLHYRDISRNRVTGEAARLKAIFQDLFMADEGD